LKLPFDGALLRPKAARNAWTHSGLCIDPGEKNLGYCLWLANPKADQWSLLKVTLGMENPIRGLKAASEVATGFAIFYDVLVTGARLLKRLAPGAHLSWAGERFLVRGRFGGTLAEVANVQLSCLIAAALFEGGIFLCCGASEWKNAFAKIAKKYGLPPLTDWYVAKKARSPKNPKLSEPTVHDIDALFIGLYNAGLLEAALTSPNFTKVFHETYGKKAL